MTSFSNAIAKSNKQPFGNNWANPKQIASKKGKRISKKAEAA